MARRGRTTGTVSVRGMKQLRTTLAAAGEQLQHLDAAHDKVADIVVDGTHAPRLTGRLDASIKQYPGANAAVIGTEVPYARYQEGKKKYLRKGVQKTAPQWTAVYENAVADVCDTVEGA